MRRITARGDKAILLGLEGGHALAGDVDVLRQFQIQKSEVAALLEAHEARIADLLRENAGLRRENEELRLPW